MLTFNEAVRAGSGNIRINNLTLGGGRDIDVTGSQVIFDSTGRVMTINPDSDLSWGSRFEVTFGGGVVRDTAGNSFAGLTAGQLNFSTRAPATTLSIASNSASKAEGNNGVATPFTFSVTRSGDLSIASTVNWETWAGTARAADGDFVNDASHPLSGILNFAANVSTQSITVYVRGDNTYENNGAAESFSVQLSAPSAGTTISATNAVGIILNDDAANRAPVLANALANQSMQEGRSSSFAFSSTTFTDPDNNALSYSASLSNGIALPTWLTFNPTTRTFSGIAPTGSPDYTVRVTATDPGGLSASGTFSIATTAAVTTAPEVAVFGGYVRTEIVDGDTAPTATDNTNFGSATLAGSAVSKTFYVHNTGNATLTTSGLSVPTGFTIIEPLAGTIAAGGSDSFTVRLDTTTAGTKSGQISFTTNDSNENPYNFAISGTVTDTTAPTLTSRSPADEATNVAANSNIVLTFNEAVRAGSGNITITNLTASGSRTIAVTDTSQVSFSGSTMTINPAHDLLNNWADWTVPSASTYIPPIIDSVNNLPSQPAANQFMVTFGSGVVKDAVDNNFSGLNSGALNFTSRDVNLYWCTRDLQASGLGNHHFLWIDGDATAIRDEVNFIGGPLGTTTGRWGYTLGATNGDGALGATDNKG